MGGGRFWSVSPEFEPAGTFYSRPGLEHSAGPFWPNRAFRGNGTTLRGVTRPVRFCGKKIAKNSEKNPKIQNEGIAG